MHVRMPAPPRAGRRRPSVPGLERCLGALPGDRPSCRPARCRRPPGTAPRSGAGAPPSGRGTVESASVCASHARSGARPRCSSRSRARREPSARAAPTLRTSVSTMRPSRRPGPPAARCCSAIDRLRSSQLSSTTTIKRVQRARHSVGEAPGGCWSGSRRDVPLRCAPGPPRRWRPVRSGLIPGGGRHRGGSRPPGSELTASNRRRRAIAHAPRRRTAGSSSALASAPGRCRRPGSIDIGNPVHERAVVVVVEVVGQLAQHDQVEAPDRATAPEPPAGGRRPVGRDAVRRRAASTTPSWKSAATRALAARGEQLREHADRASGLERASVAGPRKCGEGQRVLALLVPARARSPKGRAPGTSRRSS